MYLYLYNPTPTPSTRPKCTNPHVSRKATQNIELIRHSGKARVKDPIKPHPAPCFLGVGRLSSIPVFSPSQTYLINPSEQKLF